MKVIKVSTSFITNSSSSSFAIICAPEVPPKLEGWEEFVRQFAHNRFYSGDIDDTLYPEKSYAEAESALITLLARIPRGIDSNGHIDISDHSPLDPTAEEELMKAHPHMYRFLSLECGIFEQDFADYLEKYMRLNRLGNIFFECSCH
jgi:hypothetical protein